MRSDKEEILYLRKQGKSYSEIVNLKKISKATLSAWLKEEKWSQDVKDQNNLRLKGVITKRLSSMNLARKANLDSLYSKAKFDAQNDFVKHREDPLFIAGLMIYSGEGDKSLENGQIRVANIDHYVLRIFIKFSNKYMGIEMEKIKFWALLYPELDEEICINKWKSELGLKDSNLYKNQRIIGKNKKKKLIYGVGNITMGGKLLKVKLLEYLRLISEDLAK